MNILKFEKEKYARIDMKESIWLKQIEWWQTEDFKKAIKQMKSETPGLFFKPWKTLVNPNFINPFKGKPKSEFALNQTPEFL